MATDPSSVPSPRPPACGGWRAKDRRGGRAASAGACAGRPGRRRRPARPRRGRQPRCDHSEPHPKRPAPRGVSGFRPSSRAWLLSPVRFHAPKRPFLVLLQAFHRSRRQLDLQARLADPDQDKRDDQVSGDPDRGRFPFPGHKHHDQHGYGDEDREDRQNRAQRHQPDGDRVAGGQLLNLLLRERDLKRDEPLCVADNRPKEPSRAQTLSVASTGTSQLERLAYWAYARHATTSSATNATAATAITAVAVQVST